MTKIKIKFVSPFLQRIINVDFCLLFRQKSMIPVMVLTDAYKHISCKCLSLLPLAGIIVYDKNITYRRLAFGTNLFWL